MAKRNEKTSKEVDQKALVNKKANRENDHIRQVGPRGVPNQ
ncbi:hypothetical protein ACFSCX_20005 [Bacillus salitolerans]|uniref:Uncharacterized protein n=1 Tax=Bacillus salitolerans TaxID=1437434 RepID=A0ABW4LWA4_9BACI